MTLPYSLLTHEVPPTYELAIAAHRAVVAELERVTAERDHARAWMEEERHDLFPPTTEGRAEVWRRLIRAEARR